MATKDGNKVGAAIALIYTVGFFAVLSALFFGAVPPANEKYVLLLLGFMVGAAGTGVQFFLGSSRGSAAKDDTISKLAAPEGPSGGPAAPGA